MKGRTAGLAIATERSRDLDHLTHYELLETRYENSDVYEEVANALREVGEIPDDYTAVKSLRNPVPRVVEVYASNLIQDDLLDFIETPEGSTNNVEPLKPLIRQIYKWAEWIEIARRAFPTHGVVWLKVAQSEDKTRVYPQVLDPRYIPDWEVDERGYLTFLRLEIPQERRNNVGEIEPYTHVEVWHKQAGYMRIWNVPDDEDPTADIDELGTPDVSLILDVVQPGQNPATYTGYDFIPVVCQPFRTVLGRKIGITPYEHALPNIDRLNELVTKLHEIMFPRIIWFLIPPPGPGGEPLAPIRLSPEDATPDTLTEAERQGFRVVKTPAGEIMRAPGGSTLEAKIPPIDFASHLAIIQEESKVIEELLIELAYYRIRELQLSGIAIDLALRDLVDRLKAARENLENKGLVRFNQMAITIAQVLGIPEFLKVGTFEEGALDHSFAERPIFSSVDQQAQADGQQPNELPVEPDVPGSNTTGQAAQILAQRFAVGGNAGAPSGG